MKVLAVFLGVVACAAAASVQVGGNNPYFAYIPTPAPGEDVETFYAECEIVPTSTADDREGNEIHGSVNLRQVGKTGNTEIKLSLSGFNTDDDNLIHGFHIHEFGDLSDGCSAMEGHYNPLGVDHGSPLNGPFNRHVGDLGNISEDGTDTIIKTFSDYLVELQGPFSVIGRGMVVHAHNDDLGLSGVDDTLTTGNAGNRLACCVIGISDGRGWE